MSTTLHTTQFLSHCGFSRQALLFFLSYGGLEKRSTSLCSIILLSSILSATRPSPSLLIFMDFSAHGLIILHRPKLTAPAPHTYTQNQHPPFLPLSGLSAQSEPSADWRGRGQTATPPRRRHHHPDNQSRRHICPVCSTGATQLLLLQTHNPPAKHQRKTNHIDL